MDVRLAPRTSAVDYWVPIFVNPSAGVPALHMQLLAASADFPLLFLIGGKLLSRSFGSRRMMFISSLSILVAPLNLIIGVWYPVFFLGVPLGVLLPRFSVLHRSSLGVPIFRSTLGVDHRP